MKQCIKNITQDLNTETVETSLFVNVDVLLLMIKANANLMLRLVKMASQAELIEIPYKTA